MKRENQGYKPDLDLEDMAGEVRPGGVVDDTIRNILQEEAIKNFSDLLKFNVDVGDAVIVTGPDNIARKGEVLNFLPDLQQSLVDPNYQIVIQCVVEGNEKAKVFSFAYIDFVSIKSGKFKIEKG